jgi:Tfp pilus assembly protein PilF
MRAIASWDTDRQSDRAWIGPLWLRRRVSWASCVAALAILASAPTARAGSIVLTAEWLETWGSASPADAVSPGINQLDQAAGSFERGDLEACLKQLGQAVRAHPELPPAHALFARLAFQKNQASLIRPALERATTEDPQYPEVFLLFGELALLEGRLTDAAVHLEKARALAASQHWTAEQRSAFERLCLQGDAAVAEGRGDGKAAQAALEGWLKLDPTNAPARQRLGKVLFGLGQQQQANQVLQRAAMEDPTLEPPATRSRKGEQHWFLGRHPAARLGRRPQHV